MRRWLVLLLVCLATGLAVTATAYVCAWLNFRSYYIHTEELAATKVELEQLREAIEGHRQATGELPANLAELDIVKEKQIPVKDGYPIDAWRHYVVYFRHADRYDLLSYGADNMPGGVGKFADIRVGVPDTWPEQPSLTEFAGLREGTPVLLASILAGLLAFPICFINARQPTEKPPSLRAVLLSNLILGALAVLAALMMAALHMMPGGH